MKSRYETDRDRIINFLGRLTPEERDNVRWHLRHGTQPLIPQARVRPGGL